VTVVKLVHNFFLWTYTKSQKSWLAMGCIALYDNSVAVAQSAVKNQTQKSNSEVTVA
jgi:hypothetical protein